jgi:general secretion pathway protein M
MKIALINNKQRWLAVGLLIAVMLIMSLIFIVPIVNKGLELHNTKNDLMFKLQQYERILATKNTVLASMVNINQQHDLQGYLNSQETDALASAEMQVFIKKVIVDAGGELSSTQALPVNNKNKFSKITVSVRMMGNSEILRTVLYKIETSNPLIIIDQIDIRPMHQSTMSIAPNRIGSSNKLNVNFQAVSFMRKPTE